MELDGPRFLYEGHGSSGSSSGEALHVLPTYAIVAAHPSIYSVPLNEYLPGARMAQALHGEQYVEILGSIPVSGTMLTRPRLLDIRDKGKGKGATATIRSETIDEASGRLLAVNEFVIFFTGIGGFGSPWPSAPRATAATADNEPPDRPPDYTAEEQTCSDQAVLYRLSGDYNPLHIDPAVSSSVGFDRPILHGLCTLGVSVKLVLRALGPKAMGDPSQVKSIKARFSRHVFPGERLRVSMWWKKDRAREGMSKTVVFRTEVIDRPGGLVSVISGAAVEFHAPLSAGSQDVCRTAPTSGLSPVGSRSRSRI